LVYAIGEHSVRQLRLDIVIKCVLGFLIQGKVIILIELDLIPLNPPRLATLAAHLGKGRHLLFGP
jgi:hypothetical protein